MAQFAVQVPEGATTGTTIQVQSPGGLTLNVQVPPGVEPGGQFMVAEPQGGPPPTTIGSVGLLQANATAVPQTVDDLDFDQFIPLPIVRFDVTNYPEMASKFCGAPCCGCETKTLILQDQEAIMKIKNCCGGNTQRMPYSQLGSVDKQTNACCVGFSSDFVPVDPESGKGGMFPGFGCDEQLVNRIVSELQGRKEKRGGVAQMRKLEYMSSKVVGLARKSIAWAKGVGAPYQPENQPDFDPPRVFGTQQYDVSHACEKMCFTSKSLVLEREEALLTTNACFGLSSVQQKREYNQLGRVEMSKSCVVCRGVNSNLGAFQPGLGCDKAKVMAITTELRQRMGERGTIGQIRRQEHSFKMFAEVDGSTNAALAKEGITFPPTQDVMKKVDPKGQYPSLEMLAAQGVAANKSATTQVDTKTYDITNKCDALSTLCATCCIAGWTTTTMELAGDMMTITEKNKIDDMSVQVPYAQIDSVDWDKSCFCCFSVNSISPGWGCFNREIVEEISGELQHRKVRRGNIAQLKQLEAMQSTAVELNAKLDLILDKEGTAYPPPQQIIDKVYGKDVPRALSVPKETPHLNPNETLPSKSYNITNIPGAICTCLCCGGIASETLDLGPEEMHITRKDCCNQSNVRMPYAEMSSVEVETAMCICSQLPDIGTPGWGCSGAYVNEIAEELQQRKVKRGEIAQFKMQENMINEVLKLGVKLDVLLDKKGIPPPPPVQMSMEQRAMSENRDAPGSEPSVVRAQ